MRIFTKGLFFASGLFLFLFSPFIRAQNISRNSPFDFKKQVNISGLFYLAGQYRIFDTTQQFNFQVRRAYLTVQAQLTKNLSVRYTHDITIDNEGGDAGNIELRIKYLYARYAFPSFWIFTGSSVKFGIIQRPWIDYEEHINAYRVQGAMFMERSQLFNSSGFGLSVEGHFGGQLEDAYVKNVHPRDKGKYGSFILGIYNGGGYHQFEKNLNKNFEIRLSLRPFPGKLPGLMVSYTGLFGQGNIQECPEFHLNAGFVSYQSRFFTLTAQYEKGLGNSYGTLVDTAFRALPHKGYSFYTEVKIPKTKWALYGRYDHFQLTGIKGKINRRQIYGISWRFFEQNKLVFSYQRNKPFDRPVTHSYDMALDISF